MPGCHGAHPLGRQLLTPIPEPAQASTPQGIASAQRTGDCGCAAGPDGCKGVVITHLGFPWSGSSAGADSESFFELADGCSWSTCQSDALHIEIGAHVSSVSDARFMLAPRCREDVEYAQCTRPIHACLESKQLDAIRACLQLQHALESGRIRFEIEAPHGFDAQIHPNRKTPIHARQTWEVESQTRPGLRKELE